MDSENTAISRERLSAAPNEIYARTALEPSYNYKLTHFFEELIGVNKAWLLMLREEGVVDEQSAAEVLKANAELEAEGRDGMGKFNPAYEYFYSTMEAYIRNRVGEDKAGLLNIGRTRPEPFVRMSLRKRVLRMLDTNLKLRTAILQVAERHRDTVMALGTHMQHAQVTTLGHYLLGIVHHLERDFGRLHAAFNTTNRSTLGCGALAGSSYAVNRQRVAELLGFEGLVENTNDSVAAGDYTLEAVSAVAAMMTFLSRFCEDLYIWHTQEYSYISIGDEYSGSSSMMPQKKNPYPFEYLRSTAGRTIGEMTSAFTTLHNTNYQDIKDVEEGLPSPVFRAFDESENVIELLTAVLSTLEVHADRMASEARRHFATCTELAARLHRDLGLAPRVAHRIVGNVVMRAINGGIDAGEVDAGFVNESIKHVTGTPIAVTDELVRQSLNPSDFVAAHNLTGGPSPERVDESLRRARQKVESDGQLETRLSSQLQAAAEKVNTLVDKLTGNATQG